MDLSLGLDLVMGQNNLNWLMPTPYFLQEENGQLQIQEENAQS